MLDAPEYRRTISNTTGMQMDNCSVWVQFPTLLAPSGTEGEGVTTKEQHKEVSVRGDETVLNPECGASYMNL